MQKLKIGLIGFSGSGKSTVAAEARRNGMISADTDIMITGVTGKTPEEFILSGNESEFRALEIETVKEALLSDVQLIAFGGGVHFGNNAYRNIAESGIKLIFFRASFEYLLNRAAERPMFKLLGEKGYRSLFEEREPFYLKAANFVIDVEYRAVMEIFAEVESIWNLLFQRNLKQS